MQIKVILDTKHSNMYCLQWPDKTMSVNTVDSKPWVKDGFYGFYNKTRACELARLCNQRELVLNQIYDTSQWP